MGRVGLRSQPQQHPLPFYIGAHITQPPPPSLPKETWLLHLTELLVLVCSLERTSEERHYLFSLDQSQPSICSPPPLIPILHNNPCPGSLSLQSLESLQPVPRQEACTHLGHFPGLLCGPVPAAPQAQSWPSFAELPLY